jgi:hypothetical protein
MIKNFKLFEQKVQDWKLALDISKIWKDIIYENATELTSFNDQYINFLNKQKDLIIKKTSDEAWGKLQELITKLNECKTDIHASSAVWDDIYDWADSNMIKIKVENEELKKDF